MSARYRLTGTRNQLQASVHYPVLSNDGGTEHWELASWCFEPSEPQRIPSRLNIWDQTDFDFAISILCLMRIAQARFLSDTNSLSDGDVLQMLEDLQWPALESRRKGTTL